MGEQTFTFVIRTDKNPHGERARLDKFLVTCLPDLSRSRLQKLIKMEQVTVNNVVAKKGGQFVEAGEVVQISIPTIQPTQLVPEKIPLNIVFESRDVLVVDKPAEMVVHPSVGHESGTLVNAALAHSPEMAGVGDEHRPGVVHRLDKDTSGLILLAKNDRTHQHLKDQFRARSVKKEYLMLVDGAPPTPEGAVEAAIGRDNHNRKRMAVVPPHKGRKAMTEYTTLETFDDHTLMKTYPITGRTHQIRVHMAFLDCPVVGDRVYGRRRTTLRLNRHFLHSVRITIGLPGETKPRTFEATLSDELKQVLVNLGEWCPAHY